MNNEELTNPELAKVVLVEDSREFSRSEVVLKGALAAGAVYGTAMVGPFVAQALAISGNSDVEILNFDLALEYLESTVYKEAKSRAKANGELQRLITIFAEDEQSQVEALTATIKKLGGQPVAEPKFNFPYSNTAGFLKLAETFENTGVSATTAPRPRSPKKPCLPRPARSSRSRFAMRRRFGCRT